MVYLLATLANDAEYMPSLLYALGGELSLAEPANNETWGVGYYADGRALIIKKPSSMLSDRGVYALAPKLHSRVLLACAGATGEAPPFRFRRWLFGSTGDLSVLANMQRAIREKLPDFVRSELSEGSGPALAFGMILAELHRANVLDDPLVPAELIVAAVSRATDTVQRLTAEAGGAVQAAYALSNGRIVLATAASVGLRWKVQEGLEALPDGPPDPALTDFKQIAAALKRFRAVVVSRQVQEGRSGWQEIALGHTLVVDNALATRVYPPA